MIGVRCSRPDDRRSVQVLPGRKVRTPQGSAPGNARAGQPDGQWHRKYTALRELAPQGASRGVRVKRCGKSAPRGGNGRWQAKPRTEQDQIGRRSRTARPKLPGRSLEPASNAGPRGMIVAPKLAAAQARGAGGGQNSAYRPAAALFSTVGHFRLRQIVPIPLTLWLSTSSPAAPASSGPTWPKSSRAAASASASSTA